MIEIKITDVHNLSSRELENLIGYLKSCSVNEVVDTNLSQEQFKNNFIGVLESTIEKQYSFVPPMPQEDINKLANLCTPIPAAVFAKCPIVHEPLKPSNPQVELDSNGLPWDSRIHARTKTKNKDGSWKGLRGVGPKMLDKVEGELKTVQEIPESPSIPLPPEAPAKDFAAFMTLVTTNIANKKIEKIDVNKILSHFGIPSIPVVAARPDLIPAIIMAVEELINEAG